MAKKKIVIVGAGMAGLTAAAYLSKEGQDVQLIEKNNKCGGLLASFEREGFVFDAGARSIENAGVIKPMIKQFGIDLDMLRSGVSIGIEDEIIGYETEESLYDYQNLLEHFYPDNTQEIENIIKFSEKILKDMDVLYGIDNPLFRDLKNDRAFLFKEVLPWLGKFLRTVLKIGRTMEPVEAFLAKKTSNQSLIDIIAQHFFKQTPTFFAMGYFYVYLDYLYPKGGTGQLPMALEKKVMEYGGKIVRNTKIVEVDPVRRICLDSVGQEYEFDTLIWGADLKTLYKILKTDNLDAKTARKIDKRRNLMMDRRGSDSVYSVFLAVNEPVETFKAISNGHFFYTPKRKGLGELHTSKLETIIENFESMSKKDILNWLTEFCSYTTYEISIPAIRDPSLVPEGKTGLEFSTLFEYELIKKVQEAGWYDEFRQEADKLIIDILEESIYPGLKDKIIFSFSSTPLTLADVANSSEGSLIGWSFEKMPIPAENKFHKMTSAVKTPIPHVLKAGQWAYSPAGIPTAILTGMFAAQRAMKMKKPKT